tara:strand:+ start:448 stop:1200 length:753 start_codon:yes stop_codon:yes gene_type:complete
MFDNIIEFSTTKEYFSLKEDYPIPTKINIPKWYKKLEHSNEKRTIKGCIPFLETLTMGYILKMPQDIHIKHNFYNEELNIRDGAQAPAVGDEEVSSQRFLNLNISRKAEMHGTEQLGPECPFHEKNKNLPYHKIVNPWFIKTPPGYSCLFVPPLNNTDDRFSIIPGVVDTDVYNLTINFPIIINGDKYKTLDTVFKKGTPYVQIIPFKRDNWKMSIKPISTGKIIKDRLRYSLTLLHKYKTMFWKKKSWK